LVKEYSLYFKTELENYNSVLLHVLLLLFSYGHCLHAAAAAAAWLGYSPIPSTAIIAISFDIYYSLHAGGPARPHCLFVLHILRRHHQWLWPTT
jgi:hypothetical protein